jgi:hypothetical protein
MTTRKHYTDKTKQKRKIAAHSRRINRRKGR